MRYKKSIKITVLNLVPQTDIKQVWSKERDFWPISKAELQRFEDFEGNTLSVTKFITQFILGKKSLYLHWNKKNKVLSIFFYLR